MSLVGGAGRRSGVVIVLAVLAATLCACGSGGDDGASGAKPAGLEVAQTFETFVDVSRPTEARGDVAAKPSRTLETFVYHPVATARGGPIPLIVFSQGSGVRVTSPPISRNSHEA